MPWPPSSSAGVGTGRRTAPRRLRSRWRRPCAVLRTFGQLLGARTVVDPEIQGKVSLDLEDTPWDEALNAVCAAARCDWSYDAVAHVLRVTSWKRK